ncbi:MAG: GNAT family N-acetyltransferase [Spirochaetaceae bacterium]|nr:GNAT family N-acetyltransferase [Spirochaetaceae bacterium]
MIKQITDKDEKQRIARQILEQLREWFEVDESREKYIAECVGWTFIAAEEDGKYAGFLCLKETGNATIEIAVMGVLKDYHRHGIGRKLVEKAVETARAAGYSFMQVKTVQIGFYPDYDKTNKFYQSCGFKEFEVIREIWGEDNPCQIYVMSLK